MLSGTKGKELPGNCLTTAMGILPHTSLDEAMQLALSLDIPFWPQLPKYSYFEDMYVQVSEHFPGIIVDEQQRKMKFDLEMFYDQLPIYIENSGQQNFFQLSARYAVALDLFLDRDLSCYHLIRGQSIGPVSFGLKITDQNDIPIIYNEEVRTLLFDFMARKLNAQEHQNPFPIIRHNFAFTAKKITPCK